MTQTPPLLCFCMPPIIPALKLCRRAGQMYPPLFLTLLQLHRRVTVRRFIISLRKRSKRLYNCIQHIHGVICKSVSIPAKNEKNKNPPPRRSDVPHATVSYVPRVALGMLYLICIIQKALLKISFFGAFRVRSNGYYSYLVYVPALTNRIK